MFFNRVGIHLHVPNTSWDFLPSWVFLQPIQVQLIQMAVKAALVHNTIKDIGNDDN